MIKNNLLFNIDTLEFTVLARSYNYSFKAYEEKLLEAYNNSKVGSDNDVITLAGQTFEVMPNGNRNYKYILHNALYELRFCESYDPDFDYNYPIFVSIKAQELWKDGYKNAYDRALQYIQTLFLVEDCKISRMDFATHINQAVEIDIKPSVDTICRTNIRNIYYNQEKITGYAFGKSPILLRIYDKNTELEISKKWWFIDKWKDADFDLQKPVWNIEFQCRRNFFKERQIETVEDAFHHVPEIFKYLTEEWFRVIERNSATRATRSKTADWWKDVQNVLQTDRTIKRTKSDKMPDPSHIFKTMQGYLLSYGAFSNAKNIEELLINLEKDLKKLEIKKHASLSDLMKERRALYDTSSI